MTYEQEALERIFNLTKLNTETGCLMWQGAVGGKNDYPSMHYKRKTARATRVMYELTYGAIPKGLYVCHKCDTPLCVNPDHLFLGTQQHNMRDAARKGRVVTPNLKAEDHANAKFTNEEVVMYRKQFQTGRTTASIMNEAGVTRVTVQRMINGKTYIDLPLFPREDLLMNVKRGI